MTATILERDTAADLSDLDLLDDPDRHVACGVCYPGRLAFGDTFEAMCGRRVLATGRVDYLDPPNACGDCKALRYGECSRCGS